MNIIEHYNQSFRSMIQELKHTLIILTLLLFPFITSAEVSEKKDGIKFGGVLRYNISIEKL